MKALSIKQPWASLIAHGIKDIENRTWQTHFRGKIYIHASAKSVGKIGDILTLEQYDAVIKSGWKPNTEKPLSAIIGEVEIIDCVIDHKSIWAEHLFPKPEIKDYVLSGLPHEWEEYNKAWYKFQDQNNKEIPKPIWNWVLANPVLYDKPILNVKGKLSFWEPDFGICPKCHSTNIITWEPGHHECSDCHCEFGN